MHRYKTKIWRERARERERAMDAHKNPILFIFYISPVGKFNNKYIGIVTYTIKHGSESVDVKCSPIRLLLSSLINKS